MTLNFIFLMTAECRQAVMMGLALCIIPALLGWLAAYIYYKVPGLRQRRDELETEVKGLNTNVNKLTAEGTDLRVQLTQADAELESKKATISKLRSDLIIVESERNLLRGEPKAESKGAKAAAKAQVEKIMFNGVNYNWDDLKIVEGIGPKIEDLLLNAGIKTWKALADTSETLLVQMLEEAGPRFQMHNPATWPEQARMADAADWDGLEKYQEELKGGRS